MGTAHVVWVPARVCVFPHVSACGYGCKQAHVGGTCVHVCKWGHFCVHGVCARTHRGVGMCVLWEVHIGARVCVSVCWWWMAGQDGILCRATV